MNKTLLLILVIIFLSSFTYSEISDYNDYLTEASDFASLTTNKTGTLMTTSGCTVITGCQHGQCFDCSSKYLTYPSGNFFPDLGTIDGTMSLWINVNSVTSQDRILDDSNGGSDSELYYESTDYKMYQGGVYSSTAIPETGAWHLLTYTFNSTGVYFYYDGLLNATWEVGRFLIDGNIHDIYIGTYRSLATGFIDAKLDEWSVWNFSLPSTEIPNLLTQYYPYVSINLPSFVSPTPDDNSHNNTQVNINVSCSSGNVTLWFDNNTDPTTTVLNNVSQIANWTTDVTVEGQYYYKASCDSGESNSTVRSWFYDITDPIITINPNNFFSDDNSSQISRTVSNKNMNFTLTDNIALFGYSINITNSSGDTFFNTSNESLSGISQTIIQLVNFSDWDIGNYTVKITASDSHTAQLIPKYKVSKYNSKLKFETEANNKIDIYSLSSSYVSYEKHIDRYTFDFDFNRKYLKDEKFYVKSDKPIVYLPNSKYKAHFVVWNSEDQKGNWIDFEGIEGKATVKKISNYLYEVSIKNVPGKVKFKSIGGLNVNSQSYKFELKTLFPFNTKIYLGGYEQFNFSGELDQSFNISFNTSLVNNILQNNCNCEDCTIVNSMCRIPVDFYSQAAASCIVNLYNASFSFGIDNCINSYNIPSNTTSLNISFFDDNSAAVNVSFGSTLGFFYLPNSTQLGNYSNSNPSVQNLQYCMYPSWANLTVNQQIQYESQEGTIFDYSLFQLLFTNVTQQLNLFTQNGTTQVLFTVIDKNSNPVQNAFIHVLKFDVGTGIFTTTEILQTDSQGQTLGNIVLGTTFYNFLIYFNGQLVFTESAVKLISTTRTFTITIEDLDWFTNFGTTVGVETNLIFNNDTNNFVYTWSDSSGEMHFGCMRVDLQNDTGRYNLSNQCVASTSGTIVYNIPVLQNGTSYIATGYIKFDDEIITDTVWKVIEKSRDIFKLTPFLSLFITFIFCMTMFMFGMPNPTVSLTFLGIGVIFTSLFGLYFISGLQVGTIVAIILIQLYLGGRQTQ